MSVLDVRDVSIVYKVGDLKDIGLKDVVVKKLKGTYKAESFYADKHITFSLERGDMLGIIGSNGAGKSTLLKAISGIMRPSEGEVICNSNVVALLELGSGFDGELSVRENTFLRGALLGYTRKFMNDTYEKIIDFSELRDDGNVVTEGTKIVTSSISTKFLTGLLIGYVSEVGDDSNHLTRSGTIIPAADFKNIREVLVIRELKQTRENS